MATTRSTIDRTRRLGGIGLAVAAAAIPVQIAGGADYPTVPPGLVILVAAALLVLFVPGRIPLMLGTAVAVLISFGAVITPNVQDQLATPSDLLPFLGTVMQILGLVLAVVCCLLASVRTFKPGPP